MNATATAASPDLQRKLTLFNRLVNVRRMQTGARAAATQRKLEALRPELAAAGLIR